MSEPENTLTVVPAPLRPYIPAPVDVQRALPHSAEAEQGVLGSMLISPRAIVPEVMEKIDERHFYIPANQSIYLSLVDLWNSGRVIDLITVTQALRDRNLLETVGGAPYVTSLFTFVPAAANAGYYIEIIRDKYTLREMICACTEGARRAYEEQDQVEELVDDVQMRITSIALDVTSAQKEPLQQIMPAAEAVVERMEHAHRHKGGFIGLETGFADLDRMTLGFQPQQFIILAGRPSMGKTAMAMNIVLHVALDRTYGKGRLYKGQPVAVFSIETSAEQLVERMIASRSELNIQDLRRGLPSREQLDYFTKVAGTVGRAPIYIDDTPALKLHEFKARARRAVVEHGVVLLVVDYLQLMKSGTKRAELSKTVEIAEVSQGLKEIGRELKVPILATAQLNREPDKKASPRPRMENLKESGQIEQDADLILLLHRAEYYAKDADEKKKLAGQAELIVAKQKDGPTGDIELTYRSQITLFENKTPLYSNDESKHQHAPPEDDDL